MSNSKFQCQNFKGEHPINVMDVDITVAVSPVATGVIATHFWNHALAQEGERKLAAIYCHDVTECTFIVLTAGEDYPLIWSFHAPPGSLPGSTRTGSIAVSVNNFYKRVAEESGRLKFKADFDLVVAGIDVSSIDVGKIVTELSKLDGINSVRPLVHTVTGYNGVGKSGEHTCYDMYFFPTQSYGDKKILVTNGKGKNRGIVHTIQL
tara:strand:+ start:119 stop:739 length:621 start_codon:yes stop_codon:yes gene_type:complete